MNEHDAPVSINVPEWMPLLAMISSGADKRHPYWSLRFRNWFPEVHDLAEDNPNYFTKRVEHEKANIGQWTCRPLNKEGMPIPWSEIGL